MATLPTHTTSDRLVIRQWQVTDAPSIGAAIEASIDHLLPWMPWAAYEPTPIDQREALVERWICEWCDGGDSVFGVFLPTGEVVGGTGLHRRLGADGLEIGYWISVDHIRQGYATELSRALTDLAFTVPEIDRVEIHHDRANVASGRVPARLGFTMISELPRDVTAPGECGVICSWRVTRADWTARHPTTVAGTYSWIAASGDGMRDEDRQAEIDRDRTR